MRRFIQLIIIAVFGLLVCACLADVEAPNNDPTKPTVLYDEETMTRVAVELSGTVPANIPGLADYGFEVAEGGFSTGSAQVYSTKDQIGTNISCVATLVPGRHYAVRSYYSNGRDTKYSDENSFSAPQTSAVTLSDVSFSGGYLKASVIDDGGRAINEVGFCWGKENDIRAIKRSVKNQAVLQKDRSFSIDVTNWKPGDSYYVLAYGENSGDASSDIYGYSRSLQRIIISTE